LKTEIKPCNLVEINKENNDFWIHPDLAFQIAMWISPIFALNVSDWIRQISNKVNYNIIKDKDLEIKTKNEKIQLLQDICVKKQKRLNYPDNNVIYIVTTEYNKNKRIYI
jgi:hypothetical protein